MQIIAVILDCCFSGRARTPYRPFLDEVFERAFLQGSFLLTAAAPEEAALAVPGEPYTAFTGALIGLLEAGDPIGPRELTLNQVYRYLHRTLPRQGFPRPRCQASDRAGELVLAVNPGYQCPIPHRARTDASETDRAPGTAGEAQACPYRGLGRSSRKTPACSSDATI